MSVHEWGHTKTMSLCRNILAHLSPPITIVLFIIAVTLGQRIAFRDKHFQEIDSYTTFLHMSDAETVTYQYLTWSYEPQEWAGGLNASSKTSSDASRLIAVIPAKLLEFVARRQGFATYHAMMEQGPVPQRGQNIREFLLRSKLPLHGFFRMNEIMLASHLPPILKEATMLPLGSTYTPVMGILYASIYAIAPDYQSFMSSVMIITVSLFACSALLLFLTALRLGIAGFAAAVGTILFLFSISLYSYGFHLGSTVWGIFSVSAFVYVLAGNSDHTRMLNRASLAAGLLVFWNYLIILPYLAVLGLALAEDLRGAKGFQDWFRAGWKIARSQRIGLTLIFLCALLFVQPGQGIRGKLQTLNELPAYAYYSALNFVAWWNQGGIAINALQILTFLLLFGAGLWALLRGTARGGERLLTVHNVLVGTLCVYLLFDLGGLINFAPTRQILFLAPILYLVMIIGLERLFSAPAVKRLIERPAVATSLLLFLAVAGWASQQTRFAQVEDVTRGIAVPSDTQGVIAYGSGQDVAWRLHLPVIPIDDLAARQGRYLFVSETRTFGTFLTAVRRAAPELAQRITDISELRSKVTFYGFLAFNPYFGDNRFAFNRSNNVFAVSFRMQ